MKKFQSAIILLVFLWTFLIVTANASSGRVATPNANPGSGTYINPQNVFITCPTPGAIIRYTIDNSEPTPKSPIYHSPIYVTKTLTINAKAFKPGMTESLTITKTYKIPIRVAKPILNPGSGTYIGSQSVQIKCSTLGAVIRYTRDNSEPTSQSPIYYSPIYVTSTLTIKAKAFRPGMTESLTATETYSFFEAYKPIESFPNRGGYLNYGIKVNEKYHRGADYKANVGTVVRSILNGEVVLSGEYNGFGSLNPNSNGGVVVIKHTNQFGKTFYAIYGHLIRDVAKGDKVSRGQRIGTIRKFSNSGSSCPHLHYGIFTGGTFPLNGWGYGTDLVGWTNPESFLPYAQQ